MSPRDFWELTPAEFWLIYEYKRGRDENDYAGSLTEEDVAELYRMLDDGD